MALYNQLSILFTIFTNIIFISICQDNSRCNQAQVGCRMYHTYFGRNPRRIMIGSKFREEEPQVIGNR